MPLISLKQETIDAFLELVDKAHTKDRPTGMVIPYVNSKSLKSELHLMVTAAITPEMAKVFTELVRTGEERQVEFVAGGVIALAKLTPFTAMQIIKGLSEKLGPLYEPEPKEWKAHNETFPEKLRDAQFIAVTNAMIITATTYIEVDSIKVD